MAKSPYPRNVKPTTHQTRGCPPLDPDQLTLDQFRFVRFAVNPTQAGDFLFNTRGYAAKFPSESPSGEVRYIKADGLVVRDEAGAAIRMLGLNRDITERKHAEEMHRKLAVRLTDVLESIGDAFMAMNHDLVLTYFNAATEQMLGRKREEVIGKVLLPSGFSADGQAQELLDRGCSGFIQKPFDITALAEKVQSIL